MTDTQLITFYLKNADLFSNNDITTSILRDIGWLILKGFVFLADLCKDLYDTTFGLVDFTTWSESSYFLDSFKPILVALMALSLFALGMMLIFNNEKRPKIAQNLCIACLCITCSTVVFAQLNSLTMDFKESIDSIGTSTGTYDGPYEIVSENLYDIVYLDKVLGLKNVNYRDNKDSLPHANLNEKSFGFIDYSEVVNYDTNNFDWNSNGAAPTILKSKVMVIGDVESYGGAKVSEVYNGLGWQNGEEDDLFNEFYYRYKFDFFPALLQLGAVIVVYLTMSYKVVKLIMELFVGKLMAYVYSVELSGGQKISKTLVFIRDTYILLLFTAVLIRIFYLAMAFCQNRIDNTLAECIIILFIAFVIVDGPNLIESLLGMDAGLSSSVSRMFATYHAIRGAANLATAPARWGIREGITNSRFNRLAASRENGERAVGDSGGRGSVSFMNTSDKDENSYDPSSSDKSDETFSPASNNDNEINPLSENDTNFMNENEISDLNESNIGQENDSFMDNVMDNMEVEAVESGFQSEENGYAFMEHGYDEQGSVEFGANNTQYSDSIVEGTAKSFGQNVGYKDAGITTDTASINKRNNSPGFNKENKTNPSNAREGKVDTKLMGEKNNLLANGRSDKGNMENVPSNKESQLGRFGKSIKENDVAPESKERMMDPVKSKREPSTEKIKSELFPLKGKDSHKGISNSVKDEKRIIHESRSDNSFLDMPPKRERQSNYIHERRKFNSNILNKNRKDGREE